MQHQSLELMWFIKASVSCEAGVCLSGDSSRRRCDREHALKLCSNVCTCEVDPEHKGPVHFILYIRFFFFFFLHVVIRDGCYSSLHIIVEFS